MSFPTKIATCCYCASKTVLSVGKGRHELACTSCGAPLRDLKIIPKPVEKKAAVSHQRPVRKMAKPAPVRRKKKRSSWKKRASWLKDVAEDAFDWVEDIFD